MSRCLLITWEYGITRNDACEMLTREFSRRQNKGSYSFTKLKFIEDHFGSLNAVRISYDRTVDFCALLCSSQKKTFAESVLKIVCDVLSNINKKIGIAIFSIENGFNEDDYYATLPRIKLHVDNISEIDWTQDNSFYQMQFA